MRGSGTSPACDQGALRREAAPAEEKTGDRDRERDRERDRDKCAGEIGERERERARQSERAGTRGGRTLKEESENDLSA